MELRHFSIVDNLRDVSILGNSCSFTRLFVLDILVSKYVYGIIEILKNPT